jgi:hypothetical protein
MATHEGANPLKYIDINNKIRQITALTMRRITINTAVHIDYND